MHWVFPVAFLADSIGVGEVVLLFLVILVFFGPRRLPDLARQLGKMVGELRRGSQNFRDQMMQMDREPPADEKAPDLPGVPLPSESSDAKTGETRDGRAGLIPAIADVKSALPDPEPGERDPHDRAG